MTTMMTIAVIIPRTRKVFIKMQHSRPVNRRAPRDADTGCLRHPMLPAARPARGRDRSPPIEPGNRLLAESRSVSTPSRACAGAPLRAGRPGASAISRWRVQPVLQYYWPTAATPRVTFSSQKFTGSGEGTGCTALARGSPLRQSAPAALPLLRAGRSARAALLSRWPGRRPVSPAMRLQPDAQPPGRILIPGAGPSGIGSQYSARQKSRRHWNAGTG
jgi:hypothetical protein